MAVVTELVINADTSGADRYAQKMNEAADVSRRSMGAMSNDISALRDKAAGMVSPLGAMTVGITAAVAAGAAFLDFAAKWNRSLAEMGAAAKLAGLSIERFQQLQFAGAAAGLSNKDFASGAEKMAGNLEEAAHKGNDLSKLLDANNVKFKEGNTLLLDTDKLLDVGRDLIYRARTEHDKIKMAEMLGLTKEWVPLLDQSATAFKASQQEATALGLVINRETIERATEFDREWRKASAVFSTWMKAQLASVLPTIDDLITKAGSLRETISGLFPEASQTAKRLEVISGLFGKALEEGNLEDAAGLMKDAGRTIIGTLNAEEKALLDQQAALLDNGRAWTKFANDNDVIVARVVKAGQAMAEQWSKGPASTVGSDDEKNKTLHFWDSAVRAVERHTATVQADIKAVGLGAGAQASFRAEAQLTEGLLFAGIKINDEYAEKIKKLAAEAGAAALALEKAKVASNIDFSRKTAFLSPEDLQIAQQLKGLYGNDVPKALASSEAAGIRFNNILKGINDAAGAALSGFLKDIAKGIDPMKALADQAERFAESIIDVASKRIASDLLGNLLGGATQSAAQTAGATESATILTSAGATVAAAMVAGATEAAGILGLTVPTAAAALPVAGAVTGTELAAGGAAAGTALAVGGAAAGTAINGPVALLMAAVAAVAAWAFSSSMSAEKDRQQKAIQGYRDRAILAGTDTTTMQGALSGFDLDEEPTRSEKSNVVEFRPRSASHPNEPRGVRKAA